MEFRGIMGGLYRVSEWIMRLSVTNVLWFICSLPFFYVVMAIMFAPIESAQELLDAWKQSFLILGLLAPFTLFPATAAMFSVARKWVMGDVDVPLIKSFFRGYKENYLQSMCGGLVFLALTTLLYINFIFYRDQEGIFGLLVILFIGMGIMMIAAVLNFFSIMVHFHMKFWQIVKNSLFMAMGNPGTTILMLTADAIILYISLSYFNYFLVPFFMGSVMAMASFFFFFRTYDRLKTKKAEEDLKAQEAEEQQGALESEQGRPDADASAEGTAEAEGKYEDIDKGQDQNQSGRNDKDKPSGV